jgi:isoleucyl-tRNA synthetase
MEKGRAFKNAICLGLILDDEGRKMSKSVGNVVDPWSEIEKFGVDTFRLWMYSVNQPGESKNFDERSVEEIQKRVFNLLDNVYSFYELYRDKDLESSAYPESEHVLDVWILTRLAELEQKMAASLEVYKLMEPVRELRTFIDDLSTWYLRRSRDRIKEGEAEAKRTLYFVLLNISKLLAPFAPFAAEELYQKLRLHDAPLSVHLTEWPDLCMQPKKSTSILADMEEVRRLSSLTLEARSTANLKIRQPLALLAIKSKLSPPLLEVLRDELNVKEVRIDENLSGDIALDTTLTPLLVEEGKVRELIRSIQDKRKAAGLRPEDVMPYEIAKDELELFEKYGQEIRRTTNIEF